MSIDVKSMPRLGFGLMRLPEKDGKIDHEEVCRMVDAYMDVGLNYFDTAYMYVNSMSETAMGKTLKRYKDALKSGSPPKIFPTPCGFSLRPRRRVRTFSAWLSPRAIRGIRR